MFDIIAFTIKSTCSSIDLTEVSITIASLAFINGAFSLSESKGRQEDIDLKARPKNHTHTHQEGPLYSKFADHTDAMSDDQQK